MKCRFHLFLFFTTILLIEGEAKPFLKNPIRTLSASLLSSASSPQDPTNISDFTKRQSQKIKEFAKSDDALGDTEDDAFLGSDTSNEAVPSLLQKKIDRVMRKLRFIAQLIHRFNPINEENDPKESDDEDLELDDSDEEDQQDINGGNSTSTEISERLETLRKSYDVKKIMEEVEDEFRKTERGEDDKIGGGQTAINLGVYFMELLGSLFGLIYGAAIQLTNSTSPKLNV